jgi:sulfide:quinone oxidoreductase
MESAHHRIVIIGGGTAGLAVAAHLRRAGQADIAIIEPSDRHFYQPFWTLVGAGVVPKEASARSEARYIPTGVKWFKDSVAEIEPERKCVTTAGGIKVGYEFLVIAAGFELDWDAIPGMKEAIATAEVSTNYAYEAAPKTWQLIDNFRGGIALFHMPGTPIKCPGAPQKIMYLAADNFRRKGIGAAKVIYGSAPGTIYGIKEYAAVLDRVIERYGIDARYSHELVEIRPKKREAVFQITNRNNERAVIPYDIMHVAPPQRSPEFVRKSALADPKSGRQGCIKVDKNTLQNPDHPEIFALGDVACTPNSKTGASASRQAPVVAANLLAALRGAEPVSRYNGYVACPIVTAYGKMLLCEFDYSGKATPTIPLIDTFQERYDMWLLKRYGLPWIYWNLILRGRTVPFVPKPEVVGGAPQLAETAV